MTTLRLMTDEMAASGHNGEVFGCAYSPDNASVLSAGWDGHLRYWNAGTGNEMAALQANPKALSACAFTPNGRQWVSGSMDGVLAFWDLASHECVDSFMAHTRPISAISYAPNGKQLATASWDRKIVLRKIGNEREGKVLHGHTDIVSGCRYTLDGLNLLTWSHDGSVRLWDVEQTREITVLGMHEDRVTAAALAPDGRWAVTCGRDGSMKLWDLTDRVEVVSAQQAAEVRGCFFTLDAQSFVTVDAEGWLVVLAVPTMEVQLEVRTRLKVMCADLAPGGAQLALGCEDGCMRFVAVEGFENASVLVTATKVAQETDTLISRFLGTKKIRHVFQFTCPACLNVAEVVSLPAAPVSCDRCGRMLRVNRQARELQPR
jgi:WD40 repeat protein/ribosomal protein S27E